MLYFYFIHPAILISVLWLRKLTFRKVMGLPKVAQLRAGRATVQTSSVYSAKSYRANITHDGKKPTVSGTDGSRVPDRSSQEISWAFPQTLNLGHGRRGSLQSAELLPLCLAVSQGLRVAKR